MDSLLRDLDRERGKMESDFANLQRHYGKLHDYVQRYIQQTTIEWARLILDHPQSLLLIMETTRVVDESGYTNGDNEPIRFTILSLADGTIWDQLIRPTYSLQVIGTEYHGLTMADLTNVPHIDEVWAEIEERLTDRHLIIFGADWARTALRSVKQTYVLDNATCLHNKVKEFFGEFYELSLEKVLGYWGIEKTREQLRDSRKRILMLHQVIRHLAAGMQKQETDDSSDDTLDEHPF